MAPHLAPKRAHSPVHPGRNSYDSPIVEKRQKLDAPPDGVQHYTPQHNYPQHGNHTETINCHNGPLGPGTSQPLLPFRQLHLPSLFAHNPSAVHYGHHFQSANPNNTDTRYPDQRSVYSQVSDVYYTPTSYALPSYVHHSQGPYMPEELAAPQTGNPQGQYQPHGNQQPSSSQQPNGNHQPNRSHQQDSSHPPKHPGVVGYAPHQAPSVTTPSPAPTRGKKKRSKTPKNAATPENSKRRRSHESMVGKPGYPKPLPPTQQRAKFSDDEDKVIIQLKHELNLSWKQIADFFPNRTHGTLQVRYCMRLKKSSTQLMEILPGLLEKAKKQYWNTIMQGLKGGMNVETAKEIVRQYKLEGEAGDEIEADGGVGDDDEGQEHDESQEIDEGVGIEERDGIEGDVEGDKGDKGDKGEERTGLTAVED